MFTLNHFQLTMHCVHSFFVCAETDFGPMTHTHVVSNVNDWNIGDKKACNYFKLRCHKACGKNRLHQCEQHKKTHSIHRM